MRVAIIIPTSSMEEGFGPRCVETAQRTTGGLNTEVHPVVSTGPDFSFSKSINRGIHETPDASLWVLLNDDCLMETGWLQRMLETAERHREVGIVGALLYYPNGMIQHAGGKISLTPTEFIVEAAKAWAPFWALRESLRRSWGRHPYMFTHYRHLSSRIRLDFITGACFLITRTCLDEIGLFDEEYRIYLEDVDYCLRALQAGFELALCSRAIGTHFEGASTRPLRREKDEGLKFFVNRWDASTIEELTRHRRGFID